jgi:hypothetical protein
MLVEQGVGLGNHEAVFHIAPKGIPSLRKQRGQPGLWHLELVDDLAPTWGDALAFTPNNFSGTGVNQVSRRLFRPGGVIGSQGLAHRGRGSR